MHSLYRLTRIALGTVLAIVSWPGITGGAPLPLDSSKIAHAPVSTVPRVPSPIAGIKLLEDIFLRMHSLPQLAFNSKMKPVVAYQNQQAPMLQSQALTDPSLAIKPKEEARRAKIAMSTSAAASFPANLNEEQQAVPKDMKEKESAKKSSYAVPAGDRLARMIGLAPAQHPALSQSEPMIADDRTNSIAMGDGLKQAKFKQAERDDAARGFNMPVGVATAAGKAQFPAAGALSGAAIGGGAGTASSLARKYDTGRLADKSAAQQNRDSEEQHAGLVAMNNAVGKLYSITNQMQKAQQAADAIVANNRSNRFNYAPNAYRVEQAKSQVVAAEHMRYLDARRAVTISESPRVTEYKSLKPGAPAPPPQAAPENAGTPTDEFASGAAGGTVASSPRLEQPGLYKYTREYSEIPLAKAVPSKSALKLAMNAPNVITGIPLVRLGTPARDAQSVLGATYSIKEQQLEGWTVFTATRPRSPDTAVQLYIKHGMVEAMRIFDRSLIPADLGVGLGDSVQALKSKFGEPAFLIREPGSRESQPSAGQNYVYPISQVSFQLARTRKAAPQVVSVLIFNVK